MRRPVAPPKGLMNRNNVAPLFGHAPVRFQEGETAGLGGFGGGFGYTQVKEKHFMACKFAKR